MLPAFQLLTALLAFAVSPFVYYALTQCKIARARKLDKSTKNSDKHIIITGCDTGFGEILAKRLDSYGFTITAICLQPELAERLSTTSSSNLKAVAIDLRDHDKVLALARSIMKSGEAIYALVNNAGVMVGSHIRHTKLQDYRHCLEVNFLAHVNATKAFLPLIVEGGRIVNISSALSYHATKNISAYSASKMALQAFNDSLRREESRHLRVISINPGYHDTNMTAGYIQNYKKRDHEDPKLVRKHLKVILRYTTFLTSLGEGMPERVVDAISDALFSSYPFSQYIIGIDSLVFWLMVYMPSWLGDFITNLVLEEQQLEKIIDKQAETIKTPSKRITELGD